VTDRDARRRATDRAADMGVIAGLKGIRAVRVP
jgi:hypothetical protein